jgi:hypothetical protein
MSAYCVLCRGKASCYCWRSPPDGKIDTYGPSETFAYKSALYQEQRQYEQELAEKAQAEKNKKP